MQLWPISSQIIITLVIPELGGGWEGIGVLILWGWSGWHTTASLELGITILEGKVTKGFQGGGKDEQTPVCPGPPFYCHFLIQPGCSGKSMSFGVRETCLQITVWTMLAAWPYEVFKHILQFFSPVKLG